MVDNDFIPTAAFVDHYVVEEALAKNIGLAKASAAVLPRFNMKKSGVVLHWETRLLGMLYTMLVFPREIWKRDGLLEIVVERAKKDDQLIETIKEQISMSFLRSLRNSIAHARIEFTGNTVTLRDGPDGKESTFEVTLEKRDAVNMVLVLARAFHESAQIKQTIAKAGKGEA